MENLTFEQLPAAVRQLYNKLEAIEELLQQQNTSTPSPQEDELLTISTIHRKVSRGKEYRESHVRTNQMTRVWFYLRGTTATASMISEATGIPHKNICRYKRYLERSNLLWKVYQERCKKTGYRAWYLTTNPIKVFSSYPIQLKMFE